jgi:hypothetical protein
MKKFLTLLCALFVASVAFAQVPACVRDSSLIASGDLLSPAPYSETEPFYNLNDACIGVAYNQSVTVNVPTSFQSIPISNVTAATMGAVSNLPAGLTYACDPPNCVFPAGTLGCIVLYGTPTPNNTAPDTLDLGITATVNTAFGGIPVTFPGQLAPGSHYYLALKTAACLVGNSDINTPFTAVKNAPNPFGNQTVITVESLSAGDFQFEVFDVLGQRVHAEWLSIAAGKNEFTFEVGNLPNGSYTYTLGNRDGRAARRMVIAR